MSQINSVSSPIICATRAPHKRKLTQKCVSANTRTYMFNQRNRVWKCRCKSIRTLIYISIYILCTAHCIGFGLHNRTLRSASAYQQQRRTQQRRGENNSLPMGTWLISGGAKLWRRQAAHRNFSVCIDNMQSDSGEKFHWRLLKLLSLYTGYFCCCCFTKVKWMIHFSHIVYLLCADTRMYSCIKQLRTYFDSKIAYHLCRMKRK